MSAIKQFLQTQKKPNVSALFFIGAVASMAWAVYFSMVTIFLPYQIEFREGAALVLTKIFLSGGNPFTFENQPLGMNNYGLGYNLTVLPFAMLFGNMLAVHRAVTFIFILLASLVVFWSAYKTSRDSSLALACAAFAMTGLIAYGGIGAFPSAMGTFLFLAVVLTPFNRSFDKTSLLTAVLVSIISFYTKPYFILGFGIVATYMFLFVSKKKSVIYAAIFSIMFAVSFIIVRVAFPLYFIDTVVGNISNTYKSSAHLMEQLIQLSLYFYPALTLALVLFFRELSLARESHSKPGIFLNLASWDQPFIGYSINYSSYSLACSLAAFLFILGPHVGAYLSYAYQLLVPLFFLWLFQKIDRNNKYKIVVVLLVLFNLFVWEKQVLSPHMLRQEDPRKWTKLFKHVETSSNVLNSPVAASKLTELGLPLIDSGQTIYFYVIEPYPNYSLIGPSYADFQSAGLKYIESVDHAIEKQEFDLIMTTDGEASFYQESLISQYYFLDEKIVVEMPHTDRSWRIFIWRPLAK